MCSHQAEGSCHPTDCEVVWVQKQERILAPSFVKTKEQRGYSSKLQRVLGSQADRSALKVGYSTLGSGVPFKAAELLEVWT